MLSRSVVRIRVALLTLLVCSGGAASPVVAAAQSTLGTLSGVVTDETGAAVADVRITVTNDATALRRELTTGPEGTFTVPQLPEGQYTLRAERAGFAAHDISGIPVKASEPVVLQVELKVEGLSEAVVVTAQKRGEERVQDVPVPVTVLQADTLADHGQVLMRDYFAKVPGLSMTTNYGGVQHLVVRGLSTGSFTNPVVGVTVDDVPFGASTHNGGGNQVPDFDPGDLARIEVLRGPQGTLYGAASMGGLIRYVTREPSFDRYSGRLEAGTIGTHNGGQTGFSLRGSANIPLGRSLAVRASGYARHDPGYIDNPRNLREGLNDAYSRGARMALLWRPARTFSLKLNGLYQYTKNNGQPDVVIDVGLGDLQQNYLQGVGWDDRAVQLYSAIANVELGRARLTSITAYHLNKATLTFDRKFAFSTEAQRAFGVSESAFYQYNSVRKFSQETRLSGRLGRKFEWMIGQFFANEQTPLTQIGYAATSTGQTVGLVYEGSNDRDLSEVAGLGNLTYVVTDRVDVQVGGRVSQTRQHYDPSATFRPSTGTVSAEAADSRNSTFTYLLAPRFRLSPHVMIYTRFASGYRPGGPNGGGAIADGASPVYGADKTQTYEAGVKGEFLDRHLSIDASVYHIDWTDIQIQLRTPLLFTYNTNGSAAKSDGLELSVGATPFTGLTLSGWASVNEAILTESLPANSPAYGVRGDRLSFGARFTGNASVEQTFPLRLGAIGYVGSVVTHVGERVGQFMSTATRQIFPAYTTLDLRSGVRVDSWSANFYVNNVTDRRGAIAGGLGYQPPNALIYIRPRTMGLSIVREF